MENKEITVVSGNGDDLDISPVQENIGIEDPREGIPKDKKVIIPEEKK